MPDDNGEVKPEEVGPAVPRIHVPAPELGAEPAEAVSPNGGEGGEETPKPRKKTRRGSRGGRNRRKRPAAATTGEGSSAPDEPTAS